MHFLTVLKADSCLCDSRKQEQLKYPNGLFHDVSTIRVERRSAVSTADRHLLIAGYGKGGECYYVARTYVNLKCQCPYKIHTAVTEGTKPEDLCVEVECPHEKRLSVPWYLEVVTLSYPPNESPIAFVDDNDMLDDQVTLSWTPAARHKKQYQQYSVKVTTVAEAVESMILSSALDAGWDRDAEAMCQLDWELRLPTCVEIVRYIDR